MKFVQYDMKNIKDTKNLSEASFVTYLINSLCIPYITGFELAVPNSQLAKHFDSLRMSFCICSKNCELLKSDTS